MTPIGKLICLAYSLIVLAVIVVTSFKKIEKKEKGGWIAALLIPVMIFLVNLI